MAQTPATGTQTRSFRALLETTRPLNVLLAAVGTLTGALAGGAPLTQSAHLAPLAAAALVGAFGTAGGNLLNDLMDLPLDRTAHPERPLASGRLPSSTAWTAVSILFLAAIGIASAFSLLAGGFALALVGLLLLYEWRLKRIGLPGNLTIALVAGALFPLGALIAEARLFAPLILGALAALSHLGRELLKDAEDAAADAATRRTFAVHHGPRAAAAWAAVPLMVAVLLSPLPVLVLDWHALYLLIVAPAVLLFATAAVTGPRAPRPGQQIAKAAMLLALVAFLIGARI